MSPFARLATLAAVAVMSPFARLATLAAAAVSVDVGASPFDVESARLEARIVVLTADNRAAAANAPAWPGGLPRHRQDRSTAGGPQHNVVLLATSSATTTTTTTNNPTHALPLTTAPTTNRRPKRGRRWYASAVEARLRGALQSLGRPGAGARPDRRVDHGPAADSGPRFAGATGRDLDHGSIAMDHGFATIAAGACRRRRPRPSPQLPSAITATPVATTTCSTCSTTCSSPPVESTSSPQSGQI